jgi:hypothetical protein
MLPEVGLEASCVGAGAERMAEAKAAAAAGTAAAAAATAGGGGGKKVGNGWGRAAVWVNSLLLHVND